MRIGWPVAALEPRTASGRALGYGLDEFGRHRVSQTLLARGPFGRRLAGRQVEIEIAVIVARRHSHALDGVIGPDLGGHLHEAPTAAAGAVVAPVPHDGRPARSQRFTGRPRLRTIEKTPIASLRGGLLPAVIVSGLETACAAWLSVTRRRGVNAPGCTYLWSTSGPES